MELKEFVSEVLTDIFEDVADAQERIADKGGEINPAIKTGAMGSTFVPDSLRQKQAAHKTLCVAEFDVALTVSDKEQKGGKIGVLLGSIGVGGGRSEGVETSQITRVKFSVPYKLP